MSVLTGGERAEEPRKGRTSGRRGSGAAKAMERSHNGRKTLRRPESAGLGKRDSCMTSDRTVSGEGGGSQAEGEGLNYYSCKKLTLRKRNWAGAAEGCRTEKAFLPTDGRDLAYLCDIHMIK